MWVPTRRSWAALAVGSVAVVVLCLVSIHPFLAVTQPLGGGLLVVEGWMPDVVVPQVLSIYDEGDYSAIATTGGDVRRGSYLGQFRTFAAVMARSLEAAGVTAGEVHAVPTPHVDADRTYASALALRDWLDGAAKVKVRRIDLVTEGAHARRSRLLFEMALGEGVEVGVIALPPTEYDADAWWRSSAGVRTVIGETIGYLYAKLVFWP